MPRGPSSMKLKLGSTSGASRAMKCSFTRCESFDGSRPTERRMTSIHSSRVNCARALAVAVEVEAAELDRPQVLDVEGVVVVLDVVVRERHLGPDAAFEQAVVVPVELLADGDALRVEVLQRRPVPLLLLDVADVDLVDEPVLALGRDARLRRVGLVRPDVVVLQRGENGLHAGVDLGRVVAGAEAGEQELQHERRHVGALLDPVQQILADDLAVEDRVQLADRARPALLRRYSPSRDPA